MTPREKKKLLEFLSVLDTVRALLEVGNPPKKERHAKTKTPAEGRKIGRKADKTAAAPVREAKVKRVRKQKQQPAVAAAPKVASQEAGDTPAPAAEATGWTRSFPVSDRIGESVWYIPAGGTQRKYVIAKQARRPGVLLLSLDEEGASVIEAQASEVRLANGKPFLSSVTPPR